MEASTFAGLWRSDDGAEIELLQLGEAISGTYTAEAADSEKPCRGRVLVGTAEGRVIGFVTSCPAPHMITSWTGRLVQSADDHMPELHAICHAVERLSQELDMARSVALQTVIFTKIVGGAEANSRKID